MKIVPIVARNRVDILEIGGAESGIATKTANRTKAQRVANITGLPFFGIPLPSR